MGKGSYLGGSSLLYRGKGFSSHDPAEVKAEVASRSIKSKIALSQKEKLSRPIENFDTKKYQIYRKMAIGVGVSVSRNKNSSTKLAKKTPVVLRDEIAASGGLVAWAKMQPEFDKIQKEKEKKYERRAKQKKLKLQAKQVISFPGDVSSSKNQSPQERVAHLQNEIYLAKEIIRLATQEIDRLRVAFKK